MTEAHVAIVVVPALALFTWVLLSPERFVRSRERDWVEDLFRLTSRDRRVVETLIVAEVERGATSRAEAARLAVFRLLRDRRR